MKANVVSLSCVTRSRTSITKTKRMRSPSLTRPVGLPPAERRAHPSSLVRSPAPFSSTLVALAAGCLLFGAFPGCGEPPPAAVPKAGAAPPLAAAVAPDDRAGSAAQAPAPAVAHRFAVATENATASRIAMDVLEKG